MVTERWLLNLKDGDGKDMACETCIGGLEGKRPHVTAQCGHRCLLFMSYGSRYNLASCEHTHETEIHVQSAQSWPMKGTKSVDCNRLLVALRDSL